MVLLSKTTVFANSPSCSGVSPGTGFGLKNLPQTAPKSPPSVKKRLPKQTSKMRPNFYCFFDLGSVLAPKMESKNLEGLAFSLSKCVSGAIWPQAPIFNDFDPILPRCCLYLGTPVDPFRHSLAPSLESSSSFLLLWPSWFSHPSPPRSCPEPASEWTASRIARLERRGGGYPPNGAFN